MKRVLKYKCENCESELDFEIVSECTIRIACECTTLHLSVEMKNKKKK